MATIRPTGDYFRRIVVPALVLLAVPAVIFFAAGVLRAESGPFWMQTRFDPDYQYLFNSFRITAFLPPTHVDHPGTPVQVFGALILKILYPAGNYGDVLRALLRSPEGHLAVLSNIIMVLNLLVLSLLGATAYHVTKRLHAGVLVQLAPLSSITLLDRLYRFNPEPFLFLAVNLLLIFLLLTLRYDVAAYRRRYIPAFAVVCGLAMALKITALPILAIPALVLRTTRDRLHLVAMSLAAFIVFTLPMWSSYGAFLRFVGRVATHTSKYGTGPTGFVNTDTYLGNLAGLITGEPLVAAFFGVAAVVCAIRLRAGGWADPAARLLTGCVAAYIFQLVVVAKHPSPHYLIPVLSLGGLVLYLTLRGANLNALRPAWSPWPARGAITAVLLATLIFTGRNFAVAMEKHQEARFQETAMRQKYRTEYPDCTPVYHYRFTSPELALHFAMNWAFLVVPDAQVRLLYPGRYYFASFWRRALSNWKFHVPMSVLRSEACIVTRALDIDVYLGKENLPARVVILD